MSDGSANFERGLFLASGVGMIVGGGMGAANGHDYIGLGLAITGAVFIYAAITNKSG